MSKNYTQDGIGQSTEFGLGGNRVATNPTAPGGGTRIEVRENDNTTPSRTSGAQAQEPDEYITLAQFQSQSKWIDPVTALADANVTPLSGTTTVDGVALAVGDRVALTAQATPTENGVWVVQAGAWTRPGDFDTGQSASNRTFLVGEGASFADTTWTVSTDPPNDIIDTDPLALVQTTGQAQTSIQNIGTGTGLLAAGPQSGPGVTLSAIAAGLGIQLSGGAGAAALTVDAQVLPSATPGDADLVQSNLAGAATILRDLVSADASVTITVDGNGNVDFSANPASLPNYTSTVFVDPNGDGTASGLNPAEPTDYATAITYANANPGTLLVLADGTYSDGDGPATGTTTITAANTGIVSRNGLGSVQVQDAVTINARGCSLFGLTIPAPFATLSITAAGVGAQRTIIEECEISGDLNLVSSSDLFEIYDSILGPLNISGTVGPTVRMFGGLMNQGLTTSHTSEQAASFLAVGVGGLGATAFNHSGSATFTYNAVGIYTMGTITDSATARTNIELGSVDNLQGLNLSNNTALSGRVILRDVAVVDPNTRAPQPITVAAGYTGGLLLHSVIFDRATSTIAAGTELLANNQATANANGADFSALKVQTTQNDSAPRVLVQDPSNDSLVQWRDPATLGPNLTAGQGINPTQLASDIVQTADPIESTQTPGVSLTLYRPLVAQGNGTVVIGTVPSGTRILRTTLVVESSTNTGSAGSNCDIGFNGGTGIELQNGATDNSVLLPDTYIADDVVRTTSSEQVEAVFTNFDGVISGDVFIEYFIGA
jgi:hypothetical protein